MEQHTLHKILRKKLIKLEEITKSDVISYTWPISQDIKKLFKNFIEDLKEDNKSEKISIILSTNWWTAEWAEDLVNILRKNYKTVDFIIPDYAMSAGTILCMSWDDIYMDYTSALWPIDPQIPDQNWKYIPASGYLDRVNELIKKEELNWKLTQSELNIILQQDIWKLKFIEQAKELTVTLLKEWLFKYKFKDWETHEWKFNKEKKWKKVTNSEKKERAEEVAKSLWDVSKWHTHWRTINIEKLRKDLKLKIKDFWENSDLNIAIKEYYDILSHLAPNKNQHFLHSRKFI